jgi:hypothetical protein
MIDAISYLLVVLGILLMIAGYRRNNRNMLVLAGLILCVSAGLGEFVHGFMNGWHAGAHA